MPDILDSGAQSAEVAPTVAPTGVVASIDAEMNDTPNVWRVRIDKCKAVRTQLLPEWARNVDYRRGKQFDSDSDEDRIAVNKDWPQTKAKVAALYSQTPQVSLVTDIPELKPVTGLFAKAVNKRVETSKLGTAIDEALPDNINAAGIGAYVVGYMARTQDKEIPTAAAKQALMQMDPAVAMELVKNKLIETETVPEIVSRKFYCRRISPADILWPVEFTGSDFDEADWVGFSGRYTWAEAKHAFTLTDDQKEAVVTGDTRTDTQKLVSDYQRDRAPEPDVVSYSEIYYKDYRYNPDQLHFDCIKRLVFVDGLSKPVVDEQWKGQKLNPELNRYVGATIFPVRFLTLTYLSDECIPPSDSAISRPQVDEIIQNRTQRNLQRKRSQPVRWIDVNRMDPLVLDSIMRGEWQAIYPVNGNGSNAMGEIARANYPAEDDTFDRITQADLNEQWQIGPNQSGSFARGERSAKEAGIVQQNFQTRIGQERAQVAKFFLGGVQVLAGLMVLYENFAEVLPPADAQQLDQMLGRESLNLDVAFSIRPDSTVLLDSEQQVQRLLRVLNIVGQAPFVNPQPIIEEILSLSGIDPAKVMVKPDEKRADPVNISVRNAEDLMNPLFLALLVHAGQAPTMEELQEAKTLAMSVMMPPPMPGTGGPGGPGAMQPPGGPEGPPSPDGPPLGDPGAPPAGPGVGEEWNAMPRVTKRPEELGA